MQIGLAVGEIEFPADVLAMDGDGPGGKMHDGSDLLGALAQFDQVGHLDLHRSEPDQPAGEALGKGRG